MESPSAHLKSIRVSCGLDNVYSNDTPVSTLTSKLNSPISAHFMQLFIVSLRAQETPTGLYVSLTTFLGFGQEYVEGYYRKTGNAVFLHIFREKIELPSTEPANDGPEKKITRLAIGVEGGFDPNENKKKYEYKDHLNVVVFPDAVKIPYPNIDLPLQVSTANSIDLDI